MDLELSMSETLTLPVLPLDDGAVLPGMVVPLDLSESGEVRAAVEAFLHPLTGGLSGSGWPFGRRPRRADLLALIEALPGVDHVGSLSLTETAEEPPPAPGAALVCSDEHAIAVAGAGGAA